MWPSCSVPKIKLCSQCFWKMRLFSDTVQMTCGVLYVQFVSQKGQSEQKKVYFYKHPEYRICFRNRLSLIKFLFLFIKEETCRSVRYMTLVIFHSILQEELLWYWLLFSRGLYIIFGIKGKKVFWNPLVILELWSLYQFPGQSW